MVRKVRYKALFKNYFTTDAVFIWGNNLLLTVYHLPRVTDIQVEQLNTDVIQTYNRLIVNLAHLLFRCYTSL